MFMGHGSFMTSQTETLVGTKCVDDCLQSMFQSHKWNLNYVKLFGERRPIVGLIDDAIHCMNKLTSCHINDLEGIMRFVNADVLDALTLSILAKMIWRTLFGFVSRRRVS
jgi:hypothetical protein